VQLRRRLRDLKIEHGILRAEEYDLTDSPDGIQHFENYYLHKGEGMETITKRLKGMEQFPRELKMHILEHYEVKLKIKRLNRRLRGLR
jgi:hypothetical protein